MVYTRLSPGGFNIKEICKKAPDMRYVTDFPLMYSAVLHTSL